MSPNWWLLLIPVVLIVLGVLVPRAVLKAQRASVDLRPATAPHDAAPTGFEQSSQESREEFVRRHWQRPGVVANGVTLVDLYDRIRALEERVARAEQQS
ncbi:hypothetical protein OHB24_18505 [Kribbella sp. NBC_00482]|uniref:hypothetical protein n=1 Tax=Kribbella sp. NBC_00482 TaxID=2975968 RepID=UPI002E19A074